MYTGCCSWLFCCFKDKTLPHFFETIAHVLKVKEQALEPDLIASIHSELQSALTDLNLKLNYRDMLKVTERIVTDLNLANDPDYSPSHLAIKVATLGLRLLINDVLEVMKVPPPLQTSPSSSSSSSSSSLSSSSKFPRPSSSPITISPSSPKDKTKTYQTFQTSPRHVSDTTPLLSVNNSLIVGSIPSNKNLITI
jgi:hypothetical protein